MLELSPYAACATFVKGSLERKNPKMLVDSSSFDLFINKSLRSIVKAVEDDGDSFTIARCSDAATQVLPLDVMSLFVVRS